MHSLTHLASSFKVIAFLSKLKENIFELLLKPTLCQLKPFQRELNYFEICGREKTQNTSKMECKRKWRFRFIEEKKRRMRQSVRQSFEIGNQKFITVQTISVNFTCFYGSQLLEWRAIVIGTAMQFLLTPSAKPIFKQYFVAHKNVVRSINLRKMSRFLSCSTVSARQNILNTKFRYENKR